MENLWSFQNDKLCSDLCEAELDPAIKCWIVMSSFYCFSDLQNAGLDHISTMRFS